MFWEYINTSVGWILKDILEKILNWFIFYKTGSIPELIPREIPGVTLDKIQEEIF